MPYLEPYTILLTAKTAAHLLRRATFGPTQTEITSFTGLTATQAVQQLISNANYSPPPPVDLDSNKATAGQTYLDKPFNGDRNFDFGHYLRYWWLGLMASQTAPPSLLDKLTLFWQNHFVTTREVVDDYRFVNQYMLLLRNNALGNFRTLVTQISKDPAMLRYLNGNENEVGKPNENYARELQELFTVGAFDFAGNKNYTEDDVKAAARVLTGWKYTNYWVVGSTSFGTTFTLSKHDKTNKTFSAQYNNTTITGRSTTTAGDDELADLVTMLLNHPQTSRFICRKLYRWYVNPNVTQTIEDNVIIPLAQFFASPSNNYAIQPVIVKLLTSQVFFDDANRGSLVKSPVDLAVGAMRFFNQPVPDMTTDYAAFKVYCDFMFWRMRDMQMALVDQPSVFGYDAYYQTGYSKIWMNTTTLALRSDYTDAYIWRWLQVKPNYKMGIDLLGWVTSLQPNFSDVTGTPAISCADVQAAFSKNLFALDLFPSQTNFLIDTIMMQGIPRSSWIVEWNNYRSTPTNTNRKNAVLYRLQNLMKYMLRMAEYQLF
ncbi:MULTISPECIES: DUF1800 domain-containing protein [unclassified Spirosoma]|uniref:DUF1800 domain-containing protein n=1 Tax=unclassified Spirosoma TaxID=2621999 RepID=UPI00095DF5C7|nr:MULTISPECIES: DUF1800 domain-containing protein [unclassified Spirosoma]MBN8825555.1 DUF1800 domain-containing protein [Spirosoma sp.]OJW74197.1 MAG: hypothetical protein BGO59_13845 [Spirosoma sp. 48-14]